MNVFHNISHFLAAIFNNRSDFNRRWKYSRKGHWEGEWMSQTNGRRGALKCLLTAKTNDLYEVSFHAAFARYLIVCYTVPLTGTRDGNQVRLQGQADLGQLAGGLHEYDGVLEGDQFNCNYRCQYDHGTVHLKQLLR